MVIENFGNDLNFPQNRNHLFRGMMKSNRIEEMNYEKMSRAMRYHYGGPNRKGHLAMVREKRLVYKFGELATNWHIGDVPIIKCKQHEICKGYLCLWTKE